MAKIGNSAASDQLREGPPSPAAVARRRERIAQLLAVGAVRAARANDAAKPGPTSQDGEPSRSK